MDSKSYVISLWKMEYQAAVKKLIFVKKKILSIARTKVVNLNKCIKDYPTLLGSPCLDSTDVYV